MCVFINAQNQNKAFAEFGSGSYATYKSNDGKLEKVTKQWPVQINMGSNNDFDGNTMIESVVVSKMGVIKENFVADIPENPVYFGFKDFRISVFGDKIYYYTYTPDNATISFILSKSGSVNNYNNEKQFLESAIKQAFINQQSAKGKVLETKAANEQKLLAESSLKGKDIKKIEIVLKDVPKDMGMRSIVKFGLRATAADGKVYSTPNLGGYTPWTDFEVKTSEGVYTDDQIQVHDDAKLLINDVLTFKASSKYQPTISASETIPLNYAFNTLDMVFVSKEGLEIKRRKAGVLNESQYNSFDGTSIDIKVQKATSKSNQKPIYKIEIINVHDGKVLERLKVSENTTVNIQISGIYGDYGTDRNSKNDTRMAGNGKDGGNGGQATIYRSADANSAQINVVANAGKGGKGGTGSISLYNGTSGKDGKPGSVSTKTLSGSLSW